jgi:hypothetical protein
MKLAIVVLREFKILPISCGFSLIGRCLNRLGLLNVHLLHFRLIIAHFNVSNGSSG